MLTNVHTYFSLRYGTIKPEDLLTLAEKGGIKCMALTDINNTSACMDFVRMAPDFGIRPVLGIDFRNGAEQQFVALAKNNEGFREINEFLSHHLHTGKKIPSRAPEFLNALVLYPFHRLSQEEASSLSPHEFIGIRPKELSRLPFSKLKQFREKMLAMPCCSFRNKRDFNAHRLLRAIDNNCLLSKLPLQEQGDPEDLFLSNQELSEVFKEHQDLLRRAEELLLQCEVSFSFGTEQPHKNLRYFTGTEEQDFRLIKKLCHEGMAYRYPQPTEAIYSRLEKELEIIRQKGFLSYFLINWDITSYARSRGYFYVGRGSGANSIVAFLLRITDVDPI
ncbi:MAG: PHP domain-containing protein, partial [Bdellovibrionales bacterium]|nr:PHP domain-containing protein [Bdellovibrionales bacterium]